MFLIRTLILALAVTTASHVHSQLQHEWHWSVGSPGSDSPGYTKMDDSDHLYTIFEFNDTADINAGPESVIVKPQRGRVNTLTCVNAQGELDWHQEFYGGEDMYGEVYDLNYNHMIVGFNFIDSLVYERNGTREVLFRHPGFSACLIKMSLQGNILSKIRYTAPADFYFSRMVLLEDGRTVVTATFIDTLTLPGIPAPFLSYGKSDAVMMMIDQQLNPVWARHIGGPGREGIGSLNVVNEKIYYGISHRDTVFIPMGTSLLPVPSKGFEDFIFGYMDMDGHIQQMIPIGAEGYDNIRSIKADKEGNMYVGGYFEKEVDFAGLSQDAALYTSLNTQDGFIAKYNANGQLLWNRIFADSKSGGVYSVRLERGNEVYVSGAFGGTVDLNPGSDSLIIENLNTSQGFISKLSTDGDFHWSYWFSNTGIGGFREMIVSSRTGRIYLEGFHTAAFNCTQLPEENWIVPIGESDIFMIGFSEENVITASSELITMEVDVYPNPADDQITINAENEITSAALFDMNGRMMKHWNQNDLKEKSISIHDLLPGLYFLRVSSNDQRLAKKIIIQ